MSNELLPHQYIEDGEICSKLPEGLKDFILICSVHGELGCVPATLIRVLEKVHRDNIGCYFEIKVFDKEEYDRNKSDSK
jgi:hypothetical protein